MSERPPCKLPHAHNTDVLIIIVMWLAQNCTEAGEQEAEEAASRGEFRDKAEYKVSNGTGV